MSESQTAPGSQNAAAPLPQSDAPAEAAPATDGAHPDSGQPAAAPAPGYDFGGLAITAEQRRVFDDFSRSVMPAGVRQEIAKSAAAWLLDASQKTFELGDVVPNHRFNISHSFQLEDTSELMSFLNEMQTRGAQQYEVDAVLDWYFDRSSRRPKAPAKGKG